MLTPFGVLFVLSFLGWPLFTYELVRRHFRRGVAAAGVVAGISVLASFFVLQLLDALFPPGALPRWAPFVIAAAWLWSPFVAWLILRLRRRVRDRYDTKKA